MFKNFAIAIALALSLLPASAMGACLTRDDFEQQGLRIFDKDGSWISYKAEGDYVTETAFNAEGVPQYWFKSLYGLYIVEEGNFKDGKLDPASNVVTSYDVELDKLPPVQKGLNELLQLSMVEQNEGARSTMAHHYKYTIELPIKLGECDYDTGRIFAAFMGADDSSWGEFLYFKEFGLVYYIAYGDLGKGPEERFEPASIALGE